jgi:hypothetical protein
VAKTRRAVSVHEIECQHFRSLTHLSHRYEERAQPSGKNRFFYISSKPAQKSIDKQKVIEKIALI